jgi:hypothetical protein
MHLAFPLPRRRQRTASFRLRQTASSGSGSLDTATPPSPPKEAPWTGIPLARAVLASYDQEAPTYDDHGYPNQTQQDWVARLLRACPAAAKILDAPAGQAGTSRWWPRPGTRHRGRP